MDCEDGPPRKIAAVGYRYCPHCDQTVSKRTYRKHMALPTTFEVSFVIDHMHAVHCTGPTIVATISCFSLILAYFGWVECGMTCKNVYM